MADKSKLKKARAKVAASTKKTASPKAPKYVYMWGSGKADGNGGMKNLLGGKGANLQEMTRIGLPVPPGFTITTEVCTYYYANKRTYPKALQAQMEAGLKNMEKIMGYKFGDSTGFPLLVAVRSGARDSMPGMMDTILNLGLNDQTVLALANATKNERFAWDCYRRFIQMYGDVVLGVQKKEGEDHEPFETVIEGYKHEKYSSNIEDSKLTAADQQELVLRFKALVLERTGHVFPNDPWEQLLRRRGRRVRLLDERPRDRLSPQVQHPLRVGHRGQRPGHGLRQHRRPFRFRRRVHAQSRQRHQRILRRIPHQRAGRGRGGRRSHARARPQAEGQDAQVLCGAPSRCARPSRSISRTSRTSSSRSRTASCSCSRPATASAPPWPRSSSRSIW